MIILDTNVLSDLMRSEPDRRVVEWLDNQDPMNLAISAVTVAEILYGIERMPDGRRKRTFARIATTMFDENFAGRIFSFDPEAAIHYARQVAACERTGRGVQMADAQIAAICARHQATLATRNVRDFEPLGVEIVNPWETAD